MFEHLYKYETMKIDGIYHWIIEKEILKFKKYKIKNTQINGSIAL